MKLTLSIPGLNSPTGKKIAHYAIVFAVFFLTQVVAGATHVHNLPTLFAVMSSAAAAGVIYLAKDILGFVPTPVEGDMVSLKVKTAGYQFLTTLIVLFIGTLGAGLVAGAAHIGGTSLPDVTAVILAAIASAVAAVVQAVVGLVPAPKQ